MTDQKKDTDEGFTAFMDMFLALDPDARKALLERMAQDEKFAGVAAKKFIAVLREMSELDSGAAGKRGGSGALGSVFNPRPFPHPRMGEIRHVRIDPLLHPRMSDSYEFFTRAPRFKIDREKGSETSGRPSPTPSTREKKGKD